MMGSDSRTTQPCHLPLHGSTQMDNVLPFLGAVSSQYFLGITSIKSRQKALVAHQCEPTRDNQEEAQRQLLEIIQRTLRTPCLHSHLSELQITTTDTLNIFSFPLRCGSTHQTLASLGAVIARTATLNDFYTPNEIPPRTPTECLATILDVLDAAKLTGNSVQRATVAQCIKNAEMSRLHAAVSVETMTNMLGAIQHNIVGMDLHKIDGTIKGLQDELRGHGPFGPYPTRLHDNLYGRVWETALNAKLTEEMPPRVIQASRIMRKAFLDLTKQVPEELGRTIRESFLSYLKHELPRPWSDKDKRIQDLSRVENLDTIGFEEFLRKPTESGYEVAGDYFVGKVLFDVFKEVAPDLFSWRDEAGIRYREDIVPLKGNVKFQRLWTESKAGSGITLAHHINVSPGQPSKRVVLHNVWDLDTNTARGIAGDTANAMALRQGVPVGTGISGYTHLFTSFFLEMTGEWDLDLPHAILGLLIYLVVEGGHSWNEGLLTLEYLERKLRIGVLPVSADAVTHVTDYCRFMSIFEGCDTKEYIDRAVAYANEATILYRRIHVHR